MTRGPTRQADVAVHGRSTLTDVTCTGHLAHSPVLPVLLWLTLSPDDGGGESRRRWRRRIQAVAAKNPPAPATAAVPAAGAAEVIMWASMISLARPYRGRGHRRKLRRRRWRGRCAPPRQSIVISGHLPSPASSKPPHP